MLGSHFVKILRDEHEIMGIDLPENDITDLDKTRESIFRFEPDIILHCAAYTDVDRAEAESERAFQVNSLATRNIAAAGAEIETPIVYFSTDFVFCDSPGSTPFTEFHPPAPRGIYALSKWRGEEELRRHQPHHFIIRTSWLYGQGGKNFVDTILRLGGERDRINVVNDQVGVPTYVPDLASETLRLVESAPFGTYHISGGGGCSWFDFARAIIADSGLDCKVYPVSTVEYNAPAPRPGFSLLDHFCLRHTIGDHMPHWRESLKRYLIETDRIKPHAPVSHSEI